MKRQSVVAALAIGAFLLFAFITAALAAPASIPLLQAGETEPNNDYDSADSMTVGSYVTGEINPSTDLDYFVANTQAGREYQASLTIWDNDDLKLRMILYNGSRDRVKESSASSSSTDITWMADHTSYYIRVEAATVSTVTAKYRLDINQVAATATPTKTPTPTATPVSEAEQDGYEPNNSFTEAYTLPVATSIELNLTFHIVGDPDWFKIWAKAGKWYEATTSELSNVDTYVEVRDQYNGVVRGDDDGAGGYASQVEWQAAYNGYYYIYVGNNVGTTGSYDLGVEELDERTPSPTPTVGPTPSNPEADRCDETELGNYDFDHACIISPNESEDFNFSPPPYGGADNDFFKLWVKPGVIYECATSGLDPGVDPNMIVYTGPSWDNAIGGSDDVEPGDYNCYFAYYATYEGWLYLLMGYGDRTPPDLDNSNYTLVCEKSVPGETSTPTPTPTNTPQPTSTPGSQPATPTPSAPTATPTPEGLTIRPLTTPTPVPEATPAPRFIPISLLVYYDANNDHQPGAGEGIAGISAQAYEAATNQLLAQGFTDEQGNLDFTVAAQGPVRVSVPFFGFSQLVAGEGASIYLRVPTQRLPGATP